MFELEKEVGAWSRSVHADGCGRAASLAELSDHLYCEIDRARAEGLSDEQAFAAAVKKLGQGRELAAEHAKNRSLLGSVCAWAARFERAGSSGAGGGLLVAHAFIWAALIVASSMFMSRSLPATTSGWLLCCVILPLWWASEQILRRALRSRQDG